MIPGTVDPKTGNVPRHLPGGYLVHFEGRESDGRVHARLARGVDRIARRGARALRMSEASAT